MVVMVYFVARLDLESAASLNTEPSDVVLPASLQRTLKDIESSILTEKEKLGKQEIHTKNGNNGALLKPSTIKNKPTGTPEYNPTPRNELEDQKSKGKLGSGRSKYDLALLDQPDTDGEYDPASNYSTPGVASSADHSNTGSLPDYARQLSGGVKRKANGENEAESPIAKIPKFMSVEYTPTIIETSELTDDEEGPTSQFSDDQSEKDSENETPVSQLETSEKTCELKNNKQTGSEGTSSLPFEFTPEGFVKTVVNKENKSQKSRVADSAKTDKNKKSTKTEKSNKVADKDCAKPTEKKNNNIFNLFKEEFDNVLESCDPSTEKESSVAKVKLKEGHSKHNSHSSKSSDESASKHKLSSSSKTSSKSSDKHRDMLSDHKSQHHTSSHHKHSHDVSKKSGSKSHTHTSGDKSEKKSGTPKSEHSSKERSSSREHSSSKHGSSKHTSDHHSNSKHPSDHHSHSKHSSSGHSSDTKSPAKHDHKSSSSSSKHNSAKSSEQHKSTHTRDKSKSGSNHSKSREKENGKHSSRRPSGAEKKHILNLDVDLFGRVETDNAGSPTHDIDDDDDLADLEEFFQEDPFDECLRIFNEDSAKGSSQGRDKKVCI